MEKPKKTGLGSSAAKPTPTTKPHLTNTSKDHNSLEQQALALTNQGQLKQAEAIYRNLIVAGTINHIVYENLATICGIQGRWGEATLLLKQTLQLKPNHPDAHNNLGFAFQEQDNLNAAIACYNKALSLKPNFPDPHYNLGNALIEQGDLKAAIDSYNKALELKPNFPEAHNNLGNALQEQDNINAAIDSYNKAISLKPNYSEAHNNLGNARKENGDINAAIDSYNKAISLNPKYPEAHYNLGIALIEQGELNAAIDSCNKALELKPDYPDAHWNLSITMLLGGDYKSGWEKYEWRSKKSEARLPHAIPSCPKWDRTPLTKNNQLLLVSEQGLGDTLQFMRYALALRNQGITVSLCAPPKLHSLIKASGIDSSPLTPEQASKTTDGHWLPLLSTPWHLDVCPDNPIITEPYISTTKELIAKWQEILSGEQRPIIGINWQGNPKTERAILKGRSLPLKTFAPIAQQTNASLLSLQKGICSEQLDTCSFQDRFVGCQQQINETWNFLETAAIIANCDLVITCDTCVAHLAGGMGKTTWLLLHKVPDWRWGLKGDTSFWYPSMRLFRQKEKGNWDEVLQRVAEKTQRQCSQLLNT